MSNFRHTSTHVRSAHKHPSRYVPALLVLLLTSFLGLVSVGCTPEQLEIQQLVNRERADADLPALIPSPHATAKAQAWAETLAAGETLRHSNLDEGMPAGFRKIGENVGRGPDIGRIHEAFMRSDGHRANVLDPEYNWMGTGYARSGSGIVYVAVVFAHY
jgi:uncharacterized protein YkwD